LTDRLGSVTQWQQRADGRGTITENSWNDSGTWIRPSKCNC